MMHIVKINTEVVMVMLTDKWTGLPLF